MGSWRLSFVHKCYCQAGDLARDRRVVSDSTLLLTLDEAAETLRISEDSVRRLIASGAIKSVDVGTARRSRTRVTRAALEEFIAQRTSDRPRTSQVPA